MGRVAILRLLLVAAGALVLVPWTTARAQEPCEPVIGIIASSEGRVELQRRESGRWQPAPTGTPLCEGDILRAAELSRATLQLVNEGILRLNQNTALQLDAVTPQEEERSLFNLLSGALQSFSRKPRRLAITTPYVNGLVEGTEFAARVEETEAEITVIEGRVVAENVFGRLTVDAGGAARAVAGRAPEARLVVNPRDAVQWALFYPPVLAVIGGQPSALPADLPPPLAEALKLAAEGDAAGAIAVLDAVPPAERDARHALYRAAIALNAGQVERARLAIDDALAQDPGLGLAYALRAVIGVVQNEREAALADGREAVRLAPDSAAAGIALSYAEQALFRIPEARQTVERAVQQEPANALAWARLGELRLMLGDRRGAEEAAARASELAPALARTQLVRGFAALAAFRHREALTAFGRAIELAPADPMAHLGLGLARISQGDLRAGRKDLEVAVALDSGNALLRSYLGKAYFEERRPPLDLEQYGIATRLDPNDPTPFLYAAMSKLAGNQPVAALGAIAESVARNDQRAVFRGRLLLDEDRAVRQADQGQIYNNLGFRELGLREATAALALDPGNAAAHRLRANLFVGEERREIARISELFQAQMLQEVNLVPVQPSLAEGKVLTPAGLGGPAAPGFNEFTPLFAQNRVQLNGQALVGNHGTYGGETVLTGVYDRVSVSAGGFGYWTDGFRPNYDVKEKIANVFAQAALTPELNVQLEARIRDTESGYLNFAFDKNDFFRDFDRRLEQDSIRFGARYAPDARSDVLVSYIYNKRDERVQLDDDSDPLLPFFAKAKVEDEGSQGEAQYIFREEKYNIVAGAGYGYVDRNQSLNLRLFTDTSAFALPQDSEHSTINDPRGYVYGNVTFPQSVTWTLGGAYQYYRQSQGDDLTVDGFLPKFGVRWNVTPELSLRAAAFQAIKPVITNNRTLEPTQVAGFNQFFDDSNGTKYWRYGAGVDWQVLKNVNVGGEVSWRDVEQPLLNPDKRWSKEDIEEQTHSVYAYWTPFQEWAFGARFVYDNFEAKDQSFVVADGNVPERVTTYSVPLTAKYFSPLGFFASVGGTFVHQEVRRASTAVFPTAADGNDSFFLVDAAVGYVLPKRYGLVSFEVRNLFDTSFRYQDDSYREFTDNPVVSRYFPKRTYMGRIILNY